MNLISNTETVKVKLLTQILVGGKFCKAGEVVLLPKHEARAMISRERAVPYIEPAPVSAPVVPTPKPEETPVETQLNEDSSEQDEEAEENKEFEQAPDPAPAPKPEKKPKAK